MCIRDRVLSDHAERPAVRPAAAWYAVMTHLSFLALATGFALLASKAHSTTFARIADAGITGPTGIAAFLLLLTGFATKAGLVPLHVWSTTRPPGGAEPCLGRDERSDGED